MTITETVAAETMDRDENTSVDDTELREEAVDLAAPSVGDDGGDEMDADEAAEKASDADAGRRGLVRRLDGALSWPAALTRRARTVVVAVLAAVIVAGSAGLAFVWWTADSASTDRAAGQSAVEAARRDVPELLSYDYRNIDEAFPASAKKLLTGKFLDEYTQLGASVIQPAAKRDAIVTKADVVEASVVTAQKDDVVVLLFVNQTTTSKELEGPRLDGSRVRVHMVGDGDSWKISEFTPV
ncbi:MULTISPECIES: hypothetical protein [Gordonia]|uniref:hypothetical protein n=1 Tax=Gordonia TaxID=2053 RepID=UPI0030FEE637